MVVYISGPMTGRKNFNREWFLTTAWHLRSYGHKVLNPYTFWGEIAVQKLSKFLPKTAWYLAMARDLTILWVCAKIFKSFFLYVHEEWELSRGARLEVKLARYLDVPVILEDC